MTRFRTFRQPPPAVSGYPLDDVWSVVVPIARTNEVLNPSLETGLTGYTAGAGVLARSTAQQYHGAYSAIYTPSAAVNDGFFYGTITTVTGQIRAIHVKHWGFANIPYALTIATTAGVDLAIKAFKGTGRWQWAILYYTETSGTTRRLYFRKNGSTSVAPFYIDGVQSEVIQAGETVSTYIDGGQQGLIPNQVPPAYYWNGTPHASTSTRSSLTRAGGMVVKFSRYGWLLLSMVGLALATPQNVATEYGRIDGGYDDYTRKPSGQFTLTGMIQGRTYQQLRDNRGSLAQLFDRDASPLDQRLILRHHLEDPNGTVISNESVIPVKYQGGFGGNTDNQFSETLPLTFTKYLPGVLSDGEAGTALSVQTSVTNMSRVAERLPTGVWRPLATNFNNAVNALLYANDGNLYVAGDFTVPQTRVASWDGTTLSAMGAGLPSSILTLAQAPDGTIYAGGASMTIAAVTGTVARFTAGAWSIVGATGTMTNQVQQMIFGKDGNLYAVGVNGASRATLDRWNGTVWVNIFTHGAASTFYAVVEGNGGLYIAGIFTNLNADANQDNIAFYRISSGVWSALSTGLDQGVDDQGLALGLDGRLYGIGNFTVAGGVSVNHTFVWNGVGFAPLGSGLTNQTLQGNARTLADGSILFGGDFTLANGVTFPDPLTRWVGSTFVPLDADLPATTTGIPILAVGAAVDGRLAATYNTSGTAITAAVTALANPGTARSYPTVTIKGPSSGTARIWQLVNVTTGRAIYFNYTINAGETAVLTLTPDNLSFVSDFQGNVISTILSGSQVADFFLAPGANSISFFSDGSTVIVTLNYRPAFLSLDDVP